MVVLSGIMIQNLKRETGWHLRGTRRIGVSHDDVEVVQQCVRIIFILQFARVRHFNTSLWLLNFNDGRLRWWRLSRT